MSERLSELSASVSLELRTRVEESRGKLQAAEKIIVGLRKEAVTGVDGISIVLEQIITNMNESDELHVTVLQQINETYGHVNNSEKNSEKNSVEVDEEATASK